MMGDSAPLAGGVWGGCPPPENFFDFPLLLCHGGLFVLLYDGGRSSNKLETPVNESS